MSNVRHLFAYCLVAASLASCGRAAPSAPAPLPGSDVPQASAAQAAQRDERAVRRASVAFLETLGTAEGKYPAAHLSASDSPECGPAYSSEAGVWNACAFSPRTLRPGILAAVSTHPVPSVRPQVFSDDCRDASACLKLTSVSVDPRALQSFLSGATAANAFAVFDSSATLVGAYSKSVLSLFSSGGVTFALVAEGDLTPLPGPVTNTFPAYLATFALADGVLLVRSAPFDGAALAEWFLESERITGLSDRVWRRSIELAAAGNGASLPCEERGYAPDECSAAARVVSPADPVAVAEKVRAKLSVPGTAFWALATRAADDAAKPQ